jgi:Asp-tRNA(Asn)/Glu-tRNA(Gln) amidotransferase A subunit family amidase
MARTVEDAVRVFDVVAGTDPADPVTAEADARRPASYMSALRTDVGDLRVGVPRWMVYTETTDPEVLARFDLAVADLKKLGVTVVDDVPIPEYDSLRRGLSCPRFRYDIENYLAKLPHAPAHTLKEVEEGGKVHVTVMPRVKQFLEFEGTPETNPGCVEATKNEERLRQAVRRAFAATGVHALVYPTWNNPPRLVGDLTTPHGNNSPILSPPTGFPALTVPMGFVRDRTLPVGLQIFGDAWSEPTLIRLAYAFEQATHHRKPPTTAPALAR